MIVTYPEVEVLLGRTFSETQAAAVSALLDDLEGRLRGHLGRPLETETSIVETVRAPDRRNPRRLFLKKTPVQSVESVTVDGVAVDSDDYLVRTWGLDQFQPLAVGAGLKPEPVIVVTYTAGLTGEDPDSDEGKLLRGVIRSAAARIANQITDDALGTTNLSQEGYSATYLDASGGFTEEELRRASSLRRRRVS